MKPLCLLGVFLLFGASVAAAENKTAVKDSITVTVVGTFRTGIVAIGGETTGTTITAKGITWELEFGKNAAFRKAAEKLHGNKVIVQGSLERRRGVEIKERWIVTVTGLQAVGDAGVGGNRKPGLNVAAQVQAKGLFGTDAKDEQRADIDLWISKAVAKTGSPLALPQSGWIALTGDYQRLYTSQQGGFIIDGKATDKDGKYEVEIDACAGFPLDKKVTLKPGERKVVKLTDNPAPNNTFIALEAPVSEKAKQRTAVKGFEAIKHQLDQLKQGEFVFLHGRRLGEQAPGELVNVAANYCEKIGLKTQ